MANGMQQIECVDCGQASARLACAPLARSVAGYYGYSYYPRTIRGAQR